MKKRRNLKKNIETVSESEEKNKDKKCYIF